jgi:hypothetical protein
MRRHLSNWTAVAGLLWGLWLLIGWVNRTLNAVDHSVIEHVRATDQWVQQTQADLDELQRRLLDGAK